MLGFSLFLLTKLLALRVDLIVVPSIFDSFFVLLGLLILIQLLEVTIEYRLGFILKRVLTDRRQILIVSQKIVSFSIVLFLDKIAVLLLHLEQAGLVGIVFSLVQLGCCV